MGGGVALPGGGMPITTEVPYFTVLLDIGAGLGEICIDSAFYGEAGAWKFSGLTCGLGGEPNRPLFLTGSAGSDDFHPYCMKVYLPVCEGPTITTTPSGDLLVGNHCDGATFQFVADPGEEPITGWAVTDGIGTIDGTGFYTGTAVKEYRSTMNVTFRIANEELEAKFIAEAAGKNLKGLKRPK